MTISPWLITIARSQYRATVFMLWVMITSVCPASRSRHRLSIIVRSPCVSRPVVGSSMSRICGLSG